MEKISKTVKNLRFFDIAANLADGQYSGEYYGKKHHENDVDQVITRANQIGCDRLLIVGGYINDCLESFKIASKGENLYCTVGVHPCRANEVEKEPYD